MSYYWQKFCWGVQSYLWFLLFVIFSFWRSYIFFWELSPVSWNFTVKNLGVHCTGLYIYIFQSENSCPSGNLKDNLETHFLPINISCSPFVGLLSIYYLDARPPGLVIFMLWAYFPFMFLSLRVPSSLSLVVALQMVVQSDKTEGVHIKKILSCWDSLLLYFCVIFLTFWHSAFPPRSELCPLLILLLFPHNTSVHLLFTYVLYILVLIWILYKLRLQTPERQGPSHISLCTTCYPHITSKI